MRGRTLLVVSLSLALAAACTNHEQHFVGGPPEMIDSIKSFEDIKVQLPQAGNVALVEQYCVPCHSLRYVEMQPELTHKAWEKIVDKMIKAYGAPIPDSQTAAAIVDYLWAVRGRD